MKLLILCILLLSPLSSVASSFQECRFKLKIESSSGSELKVKVLKYLGGGGAMGAPSELNCRGNLKKSLHSKNDTIQKSSITKGQEIAVKGAVVVAKWSSYSGMTPDGAVTSKSWALSLEK